MLFVLFQSCGSSKMAAENKQLKTRIAELEMRIYELSDSPDHLADELLQDVDLLLTIPSRDNLELAQAMIHTFQDTYPNNRYISELVVKENQINQLLNSKDLLDKEERIAKINEAQNVKIQFSIQVSKKKSGFINVSLSAQNLGLKTISNVWIKATLLNKNEENYGMPQDFYFKKMTPYKLVTETLSWEYVKFNNIEGIALKDIRYSDNRQIKKLKKEDCILGQGNVKIFLEM